ncbi:MAG: sterol desaturase family protein [Hyphomicrobium sp.]
MSLKWREGRRAHGRVEKGDDRPATIFRPHAFTRQASLAKLIPVVRERFSVRRSSCRCGMAFFRFVVRYGYAPFMILGLNVAAYTLVASKHNYFWLAPLLTLALGTAFVAERALPCFEEWNVPHGDSATNAWHLAFYEQGNVNGILLLPLIAWLSPFDAVWPHHWPLWLQFAAALIFVDLMLMLLHYASHRSSILWRLHAVHHGVERLCGFNGLVRHPLHQALDLCLATGPLALLGLPVDVAILLGFAISVQLIVQHSNVDYELGPFARHIAIGRLHHLHHVNWGKEGDCNFGLFLTLWDRMLGTYQPDAPRSIRAHDMGIDDVPAFPKSFVGQLIFPFVYEPNESVPTHPEVQTHRPRQPVQPAE